MSVDPNLARPGALPRARALGRAAGLLALLLAGIPALAGVRGDAARALAWLALVAAPAGALARPLGVTAVLVPLGWIGAQWASAGRAPGWESLVLLGLFAAGRGLADPLRPAAGAGALALGALLLAILPSLGGLFGPSPWPPAVAARLLDLAPTTWVVESAGLDWMHHPAVYTPIGADAMGPEVRTPLGAPLAGSVALLVGCALSILGARRSARRSPPSETRPWPPASSSARSPRS